MGTARKAKFRRWARNGIPKRAPLKERFAFGAFKTNQGKRNEKAAGLKSKGRAQRFNTKNTRGFERGFNVGRSLTILDNLQWRGKISRIAEGFRKGKRCKVVFIRLKLSLSLEITYVRVQMLETEDGYAVKWFGSREGHSLESVQSSFHELCDNILEKIGDSRDGTVDMVSIYALKPKRRK